MLFEIRRVECLDDIPSSWGVVDMVRIVVASEGKTRIEQTIHCQIEVVFFDEFSQVFAA